LKNGCNISKSFLLPNLGWFTLITLGLVPRCLQRGSSLVQKEGSREVKRKQVFYNLDTIISVGYRIKSHVATKFRQWATQHIKEYIVKGFVLDDERLKNPDLSFDYFEELERRIQDIRTSEKRFYRKITDIQKV
jgi:hypothetical protein